MRCFVLITLLWPISVFALVSEAEETPSDAEQLIGWLLADERNLTGIRFAKVVEAATGNEVISVDLEREEANRVLEHLGAAMTEILVELNDPAHPIHKVGRINEVSGPIEDILQERLNVLEGIECSVPVNASGRVQRSGYPDLRLVDEESGRVFYLDPKLYAQGSEDSTFRTFYYTPRAATNKILDDAHHLIIGISHGGRDEAGSWQFLSWNLVDLSDFQIRLKAEFQGNNREMYRAEAILKESEVSELPDGNDES